MSGRKLSRRERKALNRANNMGIQGSYGYAGGSGVMVPMNVLQTMLQNLAPQKNQAKDFAPGSPLRPYEGVVPLGGPRMTSYPVGTNINNNDRTMGREGIPQFDELRTLARQYSGITLCERVWFDMIPKLVLRIIPRPELLADGQDETKFQKEISGYLKFFEKPDRINDIHTWLRMALKDQSQIDALAIYKHKTRGGQLYGLELIDGATIKPILDERGMTPLPPYPAFQQYPYGVPGDLYTTEQILYYRESPSTDTPYGFSRVERIIIEVNQALRKKRKDLARYTEGNLPAGIIEVPETSIWTPDQIDSYEQMWNALLAGNTAQQTRVKFTQPGFKYTRLDDVELNTPFDEFLLNIAAASYGLSMQDLAFTGDIHKSSGDSQQNVLYRRTLYPLVSVYAYLLTSVLHDDFQDDRFLVTFGGFEESEDINMMASAYNTLASIGAIAPSDIARLMKLPSVPETGPFILTKTGPMFLEDLANPEMRKAQQDATMAGYQLAASGGGQDDEEENTAGDAEEDGQDSGKKPTPMEQKKDNPPAKQAQSGDEEETQDRQITALLLRIEDELRAMRRQNSATTVRPDILQQHTGMMIAFMLDQETANQIALPDGEPADNLHVTLAYLGDMQEEALEGTLHPARTVDYLSSILQSFAALQQPLNGNVGGIGRFSPSKSSDGADPIIALVNVPGLQAFRRSLVECLESNGYGFAQNFDYTPHITLAYVPTGATSPVATISPYPLSFSSLCLAIGDDHYTFPLGGSNESWQTQSQEMEQRIAGVYRRGNSPVTPGSTTKSNQQSVVRGSGREDATEDYKRWRTRALEDVKAGRSQRRFVSKVIPPRIADFIATELQRCQTADDVRGVFNRAKDLPPDRASLVQQIQDVFKNVEQRGRTVLAGER